MALDQAAPVIRMLTKQEIDDRIRRVSEELTLAGARKADESEDAMRPRWIAPAELVSRLQRFMVYN